MDFIVFSIRIFSKLLHFSVLQLKKGLFRGNQNACSVGEIYLLGNRGEINTTKGAKMLNHQSIIELSSVAYSNLSIKFLLWIVYVPGYSVDFFT